MTEDAFLHAFFRRLPGYSGEVTVPPGDDCAAIDVGGGRWLLLAVDQLIGERHFVLEGPEAVAPRRAGAKLLARNLSDIAAMGGTPRFCLIAGSFGPDCPMAWVEEFHAGILGLAREFNVAIIGGDLARAPVDTVTSLTIVGDVPAGQAVLRGGAKAGDELWCTGSFGSSLRTEHHLDFTPRCAEGVWLRREGFARAMIDVSDGLLLDLSRLCRASGVGVDLRLEDIPRRTAETSLDQALGDGEDYELLVAVDAGRSAALRAAWPFETPLRCIGRFAGETPEIRGPDSRPLSASGWDHFGPDEGEGR